MFLKKKINIFCVKIIHYSYHVQHVIKPEGKPIKFIVKRFLYISEFCENSVSSFVIGMYLVDTNKLSDASILIASMKSI